MSGCTFGQVEFWDVSDVYKVWAVLPKDSELPANEVQLDYKNHDQLVTSVTDPRVATFSHRLVLLQGVPGRLISDAGLANKYTIMQHDFRQ